MIFYKLPILYCSIIVTYWNSLSKEKFFCLLKNKYVKTWVIVYAIKSCKENLFT